MNQKPDLFRDEEIVAALSGEGTDKDGAIRHLYRANYQSLSQYVLSNNGNIQDAEDLFQEVVITFIKLVRAGKFRGESSIKTFLFALNRNLWLNELKKRGRAQKREMKYSAQAPSEVNTEEAAVYHQNIKVLMDLVDQLGETCKKILLLYYYENRSMKEILTTLDYDNEQVVRNKKYKCLKKMEQLVSSNQRINQQLKNILHG